MTKNKGCIAIDVLIPLLKESEGCRLTAYYCPAGVLTCGWGQTGLDIKRGTKWSQEYADQRLFESAAASITQALALSPILTDHPNRLAAIADFIFNLGAGNYRPSKLKKSIDAGNWLESQREIIRWDKARVNGRLVVLAGLTTRRAKEAVLLG